MFCFEVLAAKLEDREPLSLDRVEALFAEFESNSGKEVVDQAQRRRASPTDEHPIFVTWIIKSKSGNCERLRGCKGTFTAAPLEEQLSLFALNSALEDTRFRPVVRAELDRLTCGVTILHSFKPIEEPMGWTVGVHGIRLAFRDDSGSKKIYRATYLPDVASEQGWNQHDALQSAVKKAGCSGRLEDVKDLKVTTYEGWKKKACYDDFLEWRLWLEESGKTSVENLRA